MAHVASSRERHESRDASPPGRARDGTEVQTAPEGFAGHAGPSIPQIQDGYLRTRMLLASPF